MAIKLPALPDISQRLVAENGAMDPIWYQYFRGMERRLREAGITTMLDDDQLSRLQDGATLRWDSATQKWEVSI